MEDMKVVFFYGEKEKKERVKEIETIQKKRRFWDRLKRNAGNVDKKADNYPQTELRAKVWNYSVERKQFLPFEKPEGSLPPEGRYVYYVTDRWAEKKLRRGREPIGMEWILFLISYYELMFDGLVLIQDRDMEAEELIRHFAPIVNYLGVVTDYFYDWEEVEESLSEEYGLVLDRGTGVERLHVKGDRILVIGSNMAEPVGDVGVFIRKLSEQIGGEIIWLDTAGRGFLSKKEVIEERKFIYVNMEHFFRETLLDTTHKIKYNNTR